MDSKSANNKPIWIQDLIKMDHKLEETYNHFSSWAKVSLMNYGVSVGKTVYTKSYNGTLEEDLLEDFQNQVDAIKQDMNLAFSTISKNKLDLTEEEDANWYFWDDDSLVTIYHDPLESTSVEVFSLSKDKVGRVEDRFSKFFCKKNKKRGKVHLLEASSHGVRITELGNGGVAFEEKNYNPDVAEDFKYIKAQLKKDNPDGRLFILNGPPGTGKSFFVRGLINETQGVVFLLIPSRQIGSLSDPNFFPALRRLHKDEKCPIVLILEDADDAMLPRDITNMSVISDLLNFADGIIGSIIDIRILATTNAKKMEIEPALLRKGRLGKNVLIGGLHKEIAEAVFKRLTKDKVVKHEVSFTKDDEYTLAEVYSLAFEATGEAPLDLLAKDKDSNQNVTVNPSRKRSVGF